MKNKMMNCKVCEAEIAKNAKACPHCGAKNKKPFYKKWWVWVLALILVVSMLPSDESASNVSTQTQKIGELSASDELGANDEKNAAAVQTIYHVGDILHDGDMKIVYMASGEYVEDSEYSQPEEGEKYIYLQFAFENVSDKHDDSVSFYNFEAYADGYVAEMYYGGDENISATLSPGRTTSGFVYFAVPAEASEIEIEYTTNVFTSDKIKFVYEGEKSCGYIPPVNTNPTAGAYNVGDIIESSQMKVIYLSCEEFISDNMYLQPRDGFRYVSWTFEFENLSTSDEYVSSYDFDCYADGVSCEQLYMRDDDLAATLSSGRKAAGTVTFEVPVDAAVVELEYLTNYWTSNRIVFAMQ